MPVRANRYYGGAAASGYNNPAIAQVETNLGKMFAPPEAADVLNAARATAETQKAQRLADFYRVATDPNAKHDAIERAGIGSGSFNPNQGYYAVDQGNATSIANNTADNSRALQQTAMQQRGETIRNVIAPLSEGQTRASGLGPMFGMSGLPENTQGGVKLNEGQVYVGPGGFTAAGNKKPLSEAEVRGQVLAGLPSNDQRAAVLSGVGVETVMGPSGPTFVNRSDAAGQTPLPPDRSSSLQNYTVPGGRSGTAVMNAEGKLVDSQDGTVLPSGVTTYRGQATAAPGEFGKTTEAQDRYALALAQTESPTKIINQAYSTGKLPTGGDDVIRAISNVAPNAVGPLIAQQMSPDAQNFHQAIKAAIPYQLLALSGQGVTEQEYERTTARLIPFAKDPPEVKAQKLEQFNTFQKSLRGLAGPAAAKVGMAPATAAPAGNAAPAPGQVAMPPLGAPVQPGAIPNAADPTGTAGAPAPGAQGPTQFPVPTPAHIAQLKANPGRSVEFEGKFGPGSAQNALGVR